MRLVERIIITILHKRFHVAGLIFFHRASASEVTILWRYTNLFIIIIIFSFRVHDMRLTVKSLVNWLRMPNTGRSGPVTIGLRVHAANHLLLTTRRVN